jgi:hypothetical protein
MLPQPGEQDYTGALAVPDTTPWWKAVHRLWRALGNRKRNCIKIILWNLLPSLRGKQTGFPHA